MKRPRRPSKHQRESEVILNIARSIHEEHGTVTPLGLADWCNFSGISIGLPDAEAVCEHVNKEPRVR